MFKKYIFRRKLLKTKRNEEVRLTGTDAIFEIESQSANILREDNFLILICDGDSYMVFVYAFSFLIHNLRSLLFLRAAARAHGEAGHPRGGGALATLSSSAISFCFTLVFCSNLTR